MRSSRGVYRGVYCSLVDSVEFQQLAPRARHVFLTARLSAQAGPAAIFRFYPQILAEQTGWSVRDVEAAVRALVEAGWAQLEDGILWLVNALKYDPYMRLSNAFQRKAVLGALRALPSRPIVARFCSYYGLEDPYQDPSRRPSRTSTPLRVRNTEVQSSTETTETTETTEVQKAEDRGKKPPAFAGRSAPAGAATWEAYSGAYKRRYGVLPARNAAVNGQLAHLVRRLGADEAPAVAAFYVQHNGGRYVAAGHTVRFLLYDAEKLRTEWATGRRITETGARHADQHQERGGIAQRLLERADEESRHGV